MRIRKWIAGLLLLCSALTAQAEDEQKRFGPCALAPGESLTFGRLSLAFGADGNLVLSRNAGPAGTVVLWTSGLEGRHGNLSASFRESGDLALLEDGVAYWRAGRKGAVGNQLVLSTRPPYLTIRNAGGELSWVAPTPLCFLAPNTFFYETAGKTGIAVGKPRLKTLFENPAAWEKAREHINVFQIYAQTVDANTVAELSTMFSFLRANGIALGMEAGVISGKQANCGDGIEGYGGERIADFAAKIKQAGGDLAYIAIDESFVNGHYNPKGCHLDPKLLATNVLQAYARAKASFPALQFGDIENLPGEVSAGSADYLSNFTVWYRTLNAGLDVPLAFFHHDIDWTGQTWDGVIPKMRALLKEGGTPYGVIVNGDPHSKSAVEWTQSDHRFGQRIKASASFPFEQLVFQSWDPFPTMLTPEDDPESLTNAMKFFFEPAR